MRCFLPLAALLSVALAGQSQVAVRLPFLNPAGVTYVSGPAPAGLVAGPNVHQPYAYAAGPAVHQPYAYAAGPAVHQPYAYAAGHSVHQPLAYAAAPAYRQSTFHGAQFAYHAAPVAQPVHHVAQPVSASVHHVPAVANVPVTHIEATHGVVQKTIDVAHPAVSTRKFHVRRPAIQKQFYDIEERVVVRPAGSALVELDEPIAKEQRGGAVISPALHHPVPSVRVFPAYKALHAVPLATHTAAVIPAHHAPAAPAAPTGPAPTDAFPTDQPSSSQATPNQDSSFDDSDSVSVGNPEFRSAINDQDGQNQEQEQQSQNEEQKEEQQGEQMQGQQQEQEQEQQQQQDEQNNDQSLQQRSSFQLDDSRQFQSEREQYEARQFNFASLAQQQQPNFTPDPIPGEQASNGQTEAKFEGRSLEADGRSVFPSLRNLDSASSRTNQQRLIQLLTARDGVVEVGFGRSGPASGHNIDAGGVRARVISATPTPDHAEPSGERVSTRRVVVSRPVETLQELDVIQPVTKLQRVTVNTPTLFKTARLGVAQVATSVPVIKKTYAAPILHKTYAAPLLHKTYAAPAPLVYQKPLTHYY
ncbi:proline-, glutamic acid- and leucine-rich protein 1-like [Ischnura elegans]|uniref:proline-, glutamic acid- and leucine-rich protein 1-like n=1 Tax=Ischnura elegans TaxID=197161 RepID=UPI001ED88C3B|nr:proline-, glutamic acid- and leucine-rich protein 1-like [Ischnura elegans]